MSDFLQRLREQIRPQHDAIEALPLSLRLGEGTIPRSDYRRLLGQLLYIHQKLESALNLHKDQLPAYEPSMQRTEHLMRDLAHWGGRPDDPPRPATAVLLQRIDEWSAAQPWALLGALYILEGSRMGSRWIAVRLAKGYDLPVAAGVGIDYHIDQMNERPQLWQQFRQRLLQGDFTANQQDQIVSAAVETINRIYELYQDLSQGLKS